MSGPDERLGSALKGFIEGVCEEIGPRLGTHEQERRAGMRIEEEYKRYCDSTRLEEFSCHPAAFLDVVRVSVGLYLVGILLYLFLPIVTAILGALAILLFAAELMYLKEAVDPLFPRRTGVNVYGKIRPIATSTRIVLVSGHHDSAYRFPLHEMLGRRFSTFILLTMGLGLVTVVLSFLRFFTLFFLSPFLYVFDWLFVLPVGSVPLYLVALRLRSNEVVLGANDNLSGVAVTLGVGELLKEHPLQHTEVWLVSFACEENMRGSKRFAELHRSELRDAYLLNFDGVGAGELYILTAEPMYRTTLTAELCEIAAQAARAEGLAVHMGAPSFGGTDASNFIHAGLRAISIAGISKSGFLVNWHTLNDTPDCIDEIVLVDAVRLAVGTLKILDMS